MQELDAMMLVVADIVLLVLFDAVAFASPDRPRGGRHQTRQPTAADGAAAADSAPSDEAGERPIVSRRTPIPCRPVPHAVLWRKLDVDASSSTARQRRRRHQTTDDDITADEDWRYDGNDEDVASSTRTASPSASADAAKSSSGRNPRPYDDSRQSVSESGRRVDDDDEEIEGGDDDRTSTTVLDLVAPPRSRRRRRRRNPADDNDDDAVVGLGPSVLLSPSAVEDRTSSSSTGTSSSSRRSSRDDEDDDAGHELPSAEFRSQYRQVLQLRSGGGRTSAAVAAVQQQQQQCQFETLWKKMPDGTFPPYLETGRCRQASCMFGLYECRERRYTVKILRRLPRRCGSLLRHAVPTAAAGVAGVNEEVWRFVEYSVVVGCDCSLRRRAGMFNGKNEPASGGRGAILPDGGTSRPSSGGSSGGIERRT